MVILMAKLMVRAAVRINVRERDKKREKHANYLSLSLSLSNIGTLSLAPSHTHTHNQRSCIQRLGSLATSLDCGCQNSGFVVQASGFRV